MVSKMPPGVGGEYSGVTSRISAIASVARARRGGGAGEQESSICNLQQKQVREGMTECMHLCVVPNSHLHWSRLGACRTESLHSAKISQHARLTTSQVCAYPHRDE